MSRIEISIIVQLREIADDGRSGRCAIGLSKLRQPTAIPQQSWREKFDAAVRRAVAERTRHLEELRYVVRPSQMSLGLQRGAMAEKRGPTGGPNQ